MKRILCYIAVVILLICVGILPAFAVESESADATVRSEEESGGDVEEATSLPTGEGETETKSVTETSAESVTETQTDTETETTAAGAWNDIKKELTSDAQFWAVVIMGIVMIVVIIVVLFVLLANTNPTARKSMRGMNKAVDIVTNIKNENSQTLENLKKDVEEIYINNEEKLLKIIELEEKITELTQLDTKEKRNMLMAFAYDMRIHKIICDRLAMPVTDKSAIDMWYAIGIDYIKDGLSKEDIAKIDSLFSILDGVGKKQ